VAGHKRQDVRERDLEGFKYFKKVRKLLERLHEVGCENDRAHNRDLHMDEYVTLLLLYLFNPICVSLRALQQASGLGKVQRVLRVPQSSLTSLSEAARAFDSEWLLGVIQDLGAELKPLPHDARLDDLGGAIVTLVDGTVLEALPKVIGALGLYGPSPAFKAHVEFELLRGVPSAATLTGARADERKVLEMSLRPGRLVPEDHRRRQSLRHPAQGQRRLRGGPGAGTVGRGDEGRGGA